MADNTTAADEGSEEQTESTSGGAFDITAYGAEHTSLSDREKEQVAQRVHDLLREDFGVRPESVGVEGYMED